MNILNVAFYQMTIQLNNYDIVIGLNIREKLVLLIFVFVI